MKGVSAGAVNWEIRNKKSTVSEIRLAIKDRLPSSMHRELEVQQQEYQSLTHEYWRDLLSTIKVKDKRKRAANQINKIASARADSISDRNESVSILRKKRARTGILQSNKGPQKKANNHHGTHCYCVIYKKSGMHERKYSSHSDNECVVQRNNRTIKCGMGGYTGSRADTVK